MFYGIVRLIIFTLILIFIILKLNKTKFFKKKCVNVLTVIILIILCSISFMFPVENLFINFKSPQAIFRYSYFGKITNIVYGNDSCMIYYSTGKNAYSHSILPKSSKGYKIQSLFSVKKVSHKFDKYGLYEVYNVLGTNDYYIFGTTITKEDTINIFGGNNGEIKGSFTKVENTNFIYSFVENFTNDYYILIDGNKIFISN